MKEPGSRIWPKEINGLWVLACYPLRWNENKIRLGMLRENMKEIGTGREVSFDSVGERKGCEVGLEEESVTA